jgi:trigger factor
MHVTVDTTEGLNRRMRVEIPEERISGMVNEKLQSFVSTAVIPGFRPGRAPLKLIAHRYGERVRTDVLNQLIPETFRDATTQEGFILANDPEFTGITADSGKGLIYTVVFEVYPELVLPSMETLEIQRPVAEVTEEDVDRMIETLRKQSRIWSVVERPADREDRVIIDFEGVVSPRSASESVAEMTAETGSDGDASDDSTASETAPAEPLKATGVSVELGSGKMIDGFEDGLIGAKADDERVLDLQFPSEYHNPELAGCPVTFTVRIRSVEEATLPETDDDFAKRLGIEEGGMEAIREATRRDLSNRLEVALQMETNQRVIRILLEGIGEVELPKSALAKEVAVIVQRKEMEFRRIGLDPEGLNLDPAKSEPEARRRLTLSLLLGKLVELSQITVDASKVRKQVKRIADTYQEPDQMIAWYYEDNRRLAPIESAVLQEQLVEWVLERANVTEERMLLDQFLK